jgi:rhomboid protease GluP
MDAEPGEQRDARSRADAREAAVTEPPSSIAARRSRWRAAPILIGLNVAVFAVMTLSGVSFMSPTAADGRAWGANYGPLIASGQWWRLLTAAFVHFGILHLLVNMYALRSLAIVERLVGTPAFLYVYFVSALGASESSVLWRPGGTSAGASGALFGLLGALLAFFLLHRRFLPPQVFRPMMRGILLTIAINIAFGLMVPFVDNAAHFGGFATGFIGALCVNRELVLADPGPPMTFTAKPSRKPLVRGLLLLAFLMGAAALLPARVKAVAHATEASEWVEKAREAVTRHDYGAARAACDRAIASDTNDAEAYAVRAWCNAQIPDLPAAKRDLERALALDDTRVEAHDLRAQLRRNEGDVGGQVHDLDRLVDLLPKSASAWRARAHALYAAGRWSESLRDFQQMAKLDVAETGEAQVYIWLARSRLGERRAADEELKRYMESFEAVRMSSAWRRIALAIIDPSPGTGLNVMAHGVNRDARTTCRAEFFSASLALLEHDDPEIVSTVFEKCIEDCDGDMEEYWSAKAELARLSK